MEQPLLVIKSDMINGIFPFFLRNLIYSTITVVVIYGLASLMKYFNMMRVTMTQRTIISLILIGAVIPLIVKIIIINNTKYIFYRNFVLSEFKFIKVKRISAPYSQIVNMTTNISLWDRFCNAGDITLYTSDPAAPNLVLRYVKTPKTIEQEIYRMINRHKKR